MVLTDDEANNILLNTEPIYSMNEIASKLVISRSTIERWYKKSSLEVNEFIKDEDAIKNFPKPDFHLGSSPRWKHSTIKKWLINNSK